MINQCYILSVYGEKWCPGGLPGPDYHTAVTAGPSPGAVSGKGPTAEKAGIVLAPNN